MTKLEWDIWKYFWAHLANKVYFFPRHFTEGSIHWPFIL